MTDTLHSDARRRIDAYFAGELDGDGLTTLRAHLVDCDACRGVYDARARQERMVLGDDAERLANARVLRMVLASPAVHVRPVRERSWWAAFVLAPAAALAAALVFTTALPEDHSGPVARGGDAAAIAFGVGVAAVDPATGQVLDARRPEGVALDHRLRFSVRCADPLRARLFLFGVDDALQPFWYYPLPDEGESIALPLNTALQTLPHETELRPRHHAGRLRVVALFSAQPIHLSEVEQILRLGREQGRALEDLPWSGDPSVQVESVLLTESGVP